MFFFLIFLFRIFSGRFDTSGSMILRLVHKIEGGYPERDGGAEEGQGWGDSMRLIWRQDRRSWKETTRQLSGAEGRQVSQRLKWILNSVR